MQNKSFHIGLDKKRSPLPAVLLFVAAVIAVTACTNPFAPALDEDSGGQNLLGDQTTIEGVFQNMRYAYIFKDTLIYGRLLAPDFTFVYRDYSNLDTPKDETWGRDEEMFSTTGLFQTAQNLDLVWNEVIVSIGDSVLADVSRGFNLTVTLSARDVLRVDGRVNLRLRRAHPEENWLIERWRDESNF